MLLGWGQTFVFHGHSFLMSIHFSWAFISHGHSFLMGIHFPLASISMAFKPHGIPRLSGRVQTVVYFDCRDSKQDLLRVLARPLLCRDRKSHFNDRICCTRKMSLEKAFLSKIKWLTFFVKLHLFTGI